MKVTEKMLMRYETLSAVKGGSINLKIASLKLNLSYRQTLRIWKRFNLEGMEGLSYKRTHPPHNRIKEEIVRKIAALKKNKYPDFNISHFTEWLKKEEGIKISREKVRKILIDSGLHKIWEGKRRKPRIRFEAPKSGILIHLDSSPHQWLPNLPKMVYLVLTLDDHSRKILAARFFEKDTTYNNMLLLKETLRKYGIFHLLYTDNDSKFKYLRNNTSLYFNYQKEPDDVQTQIDRALSELNIRLTHTPPFEPQGRGKIERLFGFMQERLPKEFALKGIETITAANRYLKSWIKWYNYRTHSETGESPNVRFKNSAFLPVPDRVNLDDVFSIVEKRVVKADNTISYKGRVYQLKPNRYRVSWTKAEVEIRIHPEEKIRVFYKGELIQEFKWNECLFIREKKRRNKCDILPLQRCDILALR